MKEVTMLSGFTNKTEALHHQNSLGEKAVLVNVVNHGGLPVTPIGYFTLSQDAINLLQATLNDAGEE